MLFQENIGERLSIDEVAIQNGELYTIVSNKAAKSRKGAIVAMAQGTKADDIIDVLTKIPRDTRDIVQEVTLDMSDSMNLIIRVAFPNAKIVTDRFHVQQLVSETTQDVRIDYRREALKEENEAIKQAKENKQVYKPKLYENGDTKKQLLARSRHLLFKPSSRWTEKQKTRSIILFREFSKLETAYNLSMMFRNCYEQSTTIEQAREKIQNWYKKIEEKEMDYFNTAAQSIRLHETTILNYFINRSTNASAESFNAKLKGFRALVRGVRDREFFLFRIAKLYA